MKYSFRNDYSEGAHIDILKALNETNFEQQDGYSEDAYCNEAQVIIRNKIDNQNADIHFVSAGTQANLVVISSILKPYESVICAGTGHINVHETGAIEATGHKINTVNTIDGKLNSENIQNVLNEHVDEHQVKPRLVYISNSTEVGTVYTKSEIEKLSFFCKRNNLYFFMDGARLGSALCSKASDLTLADIAKNLDVFYIGGTKNGAMLGEAIVIINQNLKENFRFHLKQKGALISKGRIFGVQFVELFKSNLYFDLANHANLMAIKISEAIKKLGYNFLSEPVSNQIFPILPNRLIEELSKKYEFYVWLKIDETHSAIRIVTSWATPESAVNKFIDEIFNLCYDLK